MWVVKKLEERGLRLNIRELRQSKDKTFLEWVIRISNVSFCLLVVVVFLGKKDLDMLKVKPAFK